jgi:threonine synthase
MSEIYQLRCIGCAQEIAPAALVGNFRCQHCNELYEVLYPGWSGPGQKRPNPGALRWLWRERRSSPELADRSGVWRFREMLPIVDSWHNIVSLGEGNTPLYDLPQSAKRL